MATRISTLELIRKNMTSVVSTVTVVVLISGAVLGAETRYAKAADVADFKTFVIRQHEVDRWENKQDALLARKQQLTDQLFMLNLKDNPTHIDKAMLQHYTEELNSINSQLSEPKPPTPTE